ncbi:MAG TPA: GntR family transcriptional regulator [Pseudolysinimonas sp.]|nr:GntR family transcriptional regulator [Pseudolysinimonas sp.]
MVAIDRIVPRLELEDPRRTTETVHSTLRELIYSGELPAGLIISQVELSEALGVSRTPLREAIRMLQEEGLIDAQANRRCRIAGFDATDVDSTCGSRIMLEALGMSLTLAHHDEEILKAALDALEEMEADEHPGVSSAWHAAHHRFHNSFTSHAPGALRDQLSAGAERAERYVRQLAQGVLMGWSHGREEHRRIYSLITERRVNEAIVATCQHYARTAVTLLADVSPEFEPAATRSAIRLVSRSLDAELARV